jgi:2-oxoglutarate ferredoxin oxidoreductase subunit delta
MMGEIRQQTRKNPQAVSRGRPAIDSELCKGCELCVHVCPEKVLQLSARANSQGFHFAEYNIHGACSACKSCAIICPDSAIEIYKYGSGE